MRQQEAADREELLAQAELGRQMKSEMDEEAAVMGHINRSRRYLNDMFEQGSSILVNMASNRERIKVCGAACGLAGWCHQWGPQALSVWLDAALQRLGGGARWQCQKHSVMGVCC